MDQRRRQGRADLTPRRLRVALDATPLLDVRTGIGAFVEEVTTRLARRDDVDLVAFGFTRIYLEQLRERLPEGATAIKRPIPARTTRRLWRVGRWPAIERWTGRIDVVHGANFVVPPARRAAELVTIHDLTPVRFPELCDEQTRRYPTIMRRAIDRGAHVHTVSQFVADEVIAELGVSPDRVHTVHNGVTVPEPGDAGRGQAIAGGARYVLFVGTLEPRKNLGALVRAFDAVAARDADLRLVLAGGAGWSASELDELIGRSPHRERVVRPGRVDDEQYADLLAGATALAYPSIYEGFGLPPLEAMARGVPVLASNAGALPEVLGDAALLVDPDADALAAGLEQVLADDALRATLVARGTERAARYSWDRCVDELVGVYRLLAGAA